MVTGSEGGFGGDGGCSGCARQVDIFIVSRGGVDTARQTDVIGINSSLKEVEECLLWCGEGMWYRELRAAYIGPVEIVSRAFLQRSILPGASCAVVVHMLCLPSCLVLRLALGAESTMIGSARGIAGKGARYDACARHPILSSIPRSTQSQDFNP